MTFGHEGDGFRRATKLGAFVAVLSLIAALTPGVVGASEPGGAGDTAPVFLEPPITDIDVSEPVAPVSSPRLDSLAPAQVSDPDATVSDRVNPLAGEPDAGARGTWDRTAVAADPLIAPDSGRTPSRTPAVGLSFAGTGNPVACGGCSPPDTNGDVGPNHYVQMVNSTKVQIWNKAGVQVLAPTNLGTFWGGGNCVGNAGDPVVLYDPLADRWVLSQFATPTHMCFAVSKTADPLGAYWLYEFNVGQFPDYFKLGVWPDAYYMSSNEANYAAYAFDRAKMLVGTAATFQKIANASTNLLLPSDVDGPTPPPAGAPNHFYTFKDNTFHGGVDRVEVYDYHVDWVTPGNSTFGLVASLPVAAFTYTSCGFFNLNCIPQGGTAVKVDQVGEWPMWRFPYRNFGTHETLLGNFSIGGGTGTAGSAVRWFELRRTGGAWTLRQQGTQDLADGQDRWMGSIAMDKVGNIALGYSSSSPATSPSIRYATRLAGDPLGTLGTEVVMQAGGGSQTGSNRWGDYSALTVDPADDCTFWYTTEYYSASSANNWATRIANFKEPSCTPTASNDAFASAASIAGPSDTKTGTNVGFTVQAGEANPTCGDASSTNTAWWNWTAPATGNITMDTFGSSFDTVLAVYTGGAVNSLTQRACNDDTGGNQSQVSFSATAGTTYRIQVDGYAGATGNITLHTTGCLGISNDTFACAKVLTNTNVGTGTSTGANGGFTVQAGEPNSTCGDTSSTNTAWWNWTSPGTGSFTLDTNGSNFDTVLGVYTGGAVNTLTPVACDDDAGAGAQSLITFNATAGTTYRLQVDGYSGATGNITVNVTDNRPVIRPFGVVVAEGNAGTSVANAVVYVETPGGAPFVTPTPITVNWATTDIPSNPGVAHPGSDFVAAASTLTIPAGSSQGTVPLTVNGDTTVEPPLLYGEWALIGFSNPSANARLNTAAFFGLGLVIIVDELGG